MDLEATAVAISMASVLIAALAVAHNSRSAVEDRQIMRDLQEEQARPYVVASAEFSKIDVGFIEFVVRNYGMTAAYNVTIEVVPPLTTTLSGGGETEVTLPTAIPTFAPGQEVRAFWDSSYDRAKAKTAMQEKHSVRIAYTDSHGVRLWSKSNLDWSIYKDMPYIQIYGTHDIAKTLRKFYLRAQRRNGEGEAESR